MKVNELLEETLKGWTAEETKVLETLTDVQDKLNGLKDIIDYYEAGADPKDIILRVCELGGVLPLEMDYNFYKKDE